MDTSADTPKDTKMDTSDKDKMDTSPDPPSATTPAAPKTRLVKKTIRTDLKIEPVQVGGLFLDTIQLYTEKEAQMAQQDRIIEETAEARNAFESYTLELRNKIQTEEDLGKYVKPEDRDRFVEQLTQMEDWLNEDGFDSTKSEYLKRLEEVKKIGEPLYATKKKTEEPPPPPEPAPSTTPATSTSTSTTSTTSTSGTSSSSNSNTTTSTGTDTSGTSVPPSTEK